ncbi:TIM barrel protein [Rhodococcus sp. NPDC057529]|uniref:TIM barrel protein n=1 Tax=Rhodococcus sp. NPDC057529 TaxID=3346158 RepID=UPI00367144C5
MITPVAAGLVTYNLYPELVSGSVEHAEAALGAIREHDIFEVWEIPYRDGIYDDPKVRSLLQDKTLLIGTQTSFIQQGMSVAAVDDDAWNHAYTHLTSAVQLAAEIGATYLAMWGGESTQERPGSPERTLKAIEGVRTRAEDGGVRLLIEAFPRCSFSASLVPDHHTAVELCKAAGGALGIMFDPAHHTLAGSSLPLDSWEHVDYLQLAAGGIDPHGQPVDSHPLFGADDANLGWADMLSLVDNGVRAGYEGAATFEVKAEPAKRRAMLETLAGLGRELTEPR